MLWVLCDYWIIPIKSQSNRQFRIISDKGGTENTYRGNFASALLCNCVALSERRVGALIDRLQGAPHDKKVPRRMWDRSPCTNSRREGGGVQTR